MFHKSWPQGYKTSSCSTQLSIKFILLINVKMPTTVGILTFISRINTASESFKARKSFIFYNFTLYEPLKFHAQLSSVQKKFYNLRACYLIACFLLSAADFFKVDVFKNFFMANMAGYTLYWYNTLQGPLNPACSLIIFSVTIFVLNKMSASSVCCTSN